MEAMSDRAFNIVFTIAMAAIGLAALYILALSIAGIMYYGALQESGVTFSVWIDFVWKRALMVWVGFLFMMATMWALIQVGAFDLPGSNWSQFKIRRRKP
jgi:hypothetical protein